MSSVDASPRGPRWARAYRRRLVDHGHPGHRRHALRGPAPPFRVRARRDRRSDGRRTWSRRPPTRPSPSALFLGWMLMMHVMETRSPSVLGLGPEEYKRVATAVFRVFSIVAIGAYLLRAEVARGFLALAFPLGAGRTRRQSVAVAPVASAQASPGPLPLLGGSRRRRPACRAQPALADALPVVGLPRGWRLRPRCRPQALRGPSPGAGPAARGRRPGPAPQGRRRHRLLHRLQRALADQADRLGHRGRRHRPHGLLGADRRRRSAHARPPRRGPAADPRRGAALRRRHPRRQGPLRAGEWRCSGSRS